MKAVLYTILAALLAFDLWGAMLAWGIRGGIIYP